jgi:D-sedoheptulose 7-phosphate isomerase
MIEKYIDSYINEMKSSLTNLPYQPVEEAVDCLYQAWLQEQQVFIMGNGGSASTATHFACDLSKCTIVDGKNRFKAVSLNDNIPLVSALTNDNGFNSIYLEQLQPFLRSGDVVVTISVHGGSGRDKAGLWSQNLVQALKFAKEKEARTIGLTGFDGGIMKNLADICIVVPSNSTPQVESIHLAIEHLICNSLRQKIANG